MPRPEITMSELDRAIAEEYTKGDLEKITQRSVHEAMEKYVEDNGITLQFRSEMCDAVMTGVQTMQLNGTDPIAAWRSGIVNAFLMGWIAQKTFGEHEAPIEI